MAPCLWSSMPSTDRERRPSALLWGLAVLSLVLLLWQWFAARRFPLHQRRGGISETAPAITLFKPLKGCDAATESCLRSWFTQNYPGEIQLLFAVVSNDDPVCEVVRKLISEFSHRDADEGAWNADRKVLFYNALIAAKPFGD